MGVAIEEVLSACADAVVEIKCWSAMKKTATGVCIVLQCVIAVQSLLAESKQQPPFSSLNAPTGKADHLK